MTQRSVKRRSSLFLEGAALPIEIRAYIEQHQLEPILTKAFNEVMQWRKENLPKEYIKILKRVGY